MANIKSAKKRIKVAATKTLRNKAIKSGVKTAIKKVDAAVAAGDTELANASLLNAISVIDKATTKGVYHKNTSARKVSRLTKAVNSIQGRESEKAKQTIFSFEGFDNPFADETQDDFELISFLVLR